MNKVKKIVVFLILLITISLISSMPYKVFADNFDFNAFNESTHNATANVQNAVNKSTGLAITIARIVCVTIAIVMLLTIAMKYMISAPGERADIKKHAINYVIGAFILFGVTGILGIINNFAKEIK